MTGPAAVTEAFWEFVNGEGMGEWSWRNFTKMVEPKLVEDILILPIWSFGAGHQVKNSGFMWEERGEGVLVKHHFADSWRKDHSP